MNDKTRATVGYTALGLVVGLLIFPWFYIWSTRSETAEKGNPIWVVVYFAVFLVPALLFGLMGPRRSELAR